MGQTKHIEIRIKQHILDIKKFMPYIKTTSVSPHFNLKNHDPFIYFKFYVVEDKIDEYDLRLKKESTLINLF